MSPSLNIQSSPQVPLEELFKDYMPSIEEKLDVLCDDEQYAVVIGRSQSTHEKYGLQGTLYTAIICEQNSEHFGKKVLIDVINPHKIFVSGKTGSGKSYTLGVLAEELAQQELGIGTILVDPMGVFWSMKYPKKAEEDGVLEKWGLKPQKFTNIKVFVPIELKDRYNPGTFDDLFSINPSELTAEDWTGTFGLDYFKDIQSSLFIEIVETLNELYKDSFSYTIDDMLTLIETSDVIQDRYQSSTIRAVRTRLESAKNWGVFSTEGTHLEEISSPNQVTVLDVSQLPENTRGLVVGLLAKKILNRRTQIANREHFGIYQDSEDSDADIPVTWLFVDEVHTLVPSRGRTAASVPLIEYAKRGRMPGCALVLATQQPSATSDEILSQVDIMISHNLSFSQDIYELKRRTPSRLPSDIGSEGFIRNLPVGAAIFSDQSTTTKRAFVARVRPRTTEHGGKAISPIARSVKPEVVLVPQPVTASLEDSPVLKTELLPEPLEEKVPRVVQKIDLSFLNVPELDIDDELGEDYLRRFMLFRVYKEEITKPTINIAVNKTWGKELEEYKNTITNYLSSGYEVNEKQVDGNQLLLLKKGEDQIAMTAIKTINSVFFSILS